MPFDPELFSKLQDDPTYGSKPFTPFVPFNNEPPTTQIIDLPTTSRSGSASSSTDDNSVHISTFAKSIAANPERLGIWNKMSAAEKDAEVNAYLSKIRGSNPNTPSSSEPWNPFKGIGDWLGGINNDPANYAPVPSRAGASIGSAEGDKEPPWLGRAGTYDPSIFERITNAMPQNVVGNAMRNNANYFDQGMGNVGSFLTQPLNLGNIQKGIADLQINPTSYPVATYPVQDSPNLNPMDTPIGRRLSASMPLPDINPMNKFFEELFARKEQQYPVGVPQPSAYRRPY